MRAAPPRSAVRPEGGTPGGTVGPGIELPPPPWIIAHRGASGELLENTVEAVRRAIEQRAPMCEVDVQLTRDGELVVFHDRDLQRLAGDPRVVEECDAGELLGSRLALAAAAGNGLPAAAGGDRVGVLASLAALLAALPCDYPLDLELKRYHADRARFARSLAACVAGRRNLLVSSFDHDLLAEVSALLPEVPRCPLESRHAECLLGSGDRLHAWALGCHRRLATAELAAAAASAGRPLLAYTVNDAPTARRLLAAGVSGLFSDWPERLRRELATC